MGFEQAQALYDIVRSDAQLTRSLFRQALQDPRAPWINWSPLPKPRG